MNKNILIVILAGISIALFSMLLKQNPTTDSKEEIAPSQEADTSSLDLSNQGLDKLPQSALNNTNIQRLNISNNNITGALPSEIGKLRNLVVLDASNNKMTGVPAEVGQLSNLQKY